MNSRDLRFVLFEFLKLDRLMKSEKFSQLEINDLNMTLKEAEKIAIIRQIRKATARAAI